MFLAQLFHSDCCWQKAPAVTKHSGQQNPIYILRCIYFQKSLENIMTNLVPQMWSDTRYTLFWLFFILFWTESRVSLHRFFFHCIQYLETCNSFLYPDLSDSEEMTRKHGRPDNFLNNLWTDDMSVKGIFKKTRRIMYKKNSSQNCTNILKFG
jgi:hypothetical protein